MDLNSADREQILSFLKKIIVETLHDQSVKVYLFGSWARKEEKRTSDIDIALSADSAIPISKWVELRERIEESPLPYRVDLVDLSKVDQAMKEKVKKEGILWNG